MIYSQWRPEGGFDYYESSKTHPIGDDLPDVRMPNVSGNIGIPAQDVGQPLPADAVFVGRGNQPKGIMTKMTRSGLRGLGQVKTKLSKNDIVVVIAIIGVLTAAAIGSRADARRA